MVGGATFALVDSCEVYNTGYLIQSSLVLYVLAPLLQGVPHMVAFFFIFCHTHLLSSFWTSRGHRCRLFSSPVLAFNLYRA